MGMLGSWIVPPHPSWYLYTHAYYEWIHSARCISDHFGHCADQLGAGSRAQAMREAKEAKEEAGERMAEPFHAAGLATRVSSNTLLAWHPLRSALQELKKNIGFRPFTKRINFRVG